MPRRKAAVKREILPDPLYGSEQVAKFINIVMKEGKKSIAEKIVYSALSLLSDRIKKSKDKDDDSASDSSSGSKSGAGKGGSTRAVTSDEVLENLKKTLTTVAPTVEVKSRRVGGATYQVPIEVAPDRGVALAMRWVVDSARKRSEKTMALRLAGELHDAYLGRGGSIKTRDDLYRMAKANQAFAHFRW